MADAQIWKRRVQAWRKSEKRSDDFCSGMSFSAALLRHWAWRLGMTRRRRASAGPPSEQVPLARVVKAPPLPGASIDRKAPVRRSVRLVVGGARIEVAPGFDVAVLESVLGVLEQRAAARRAGR
jgi:hypothetical protein